MKSNSDFSLFLLNNFKEHGANLGDAPNSANFYTVKHNEKVVCVFALARRGTLLISGIVDEEAFPVILDICLKEPISIQAVIGEWRVCKGFWEYLKTQKVIREEVKSSKEVLFSLPTNHEEWQVQTAVRVLTEDDYVQWAILRDLYYRELGFPNTLSEVQQKADFLSKAELGILWGYFNGELLTSIADLNAFIPPYGQLGGVFTHPGYRRQGMSRKVMHQVFSDCRTILGVERLTIFTGSHNVEAQKLYTSMGAEQKGYFALLFGR